MSRQSEAGRDGRAARNHDSGPTEGATPAQQAAQQQRDNARAVYVISVAAELAGVHPQTLRIYERRGLLDPARTGGGNRRYSEDDIRHLRRIQELTSAGVNLEGVRRILELEDANRHLRAELEQTRRQARDAVESAHRQYRRDLVPVTKSLLPTRFRKGSL